LFFFICHCLFYVFDHFFLVMSCLFVVINPNNPSIASHFWREVKPLGVYPPGRVATPCCFFGFFFPCNLCNYCATMEVSNSDEELIYQCTGQRVVKICVSLLKPWPFLEVKGRRKPWCKVYAQRVCNCAGAVATHEPLGSMRVQAFVRQYTLDHLIFLFSFRHTASPPIKSGTHTGGVQH